MSHSLSGRFCIPLLLCATLVASSTQSAASLLAIDQFSELTTVTTEDPPMPKWTMEQTVFVWFKTKTFVDKLRNEVAIRLHNEESAASVLQEMTTILDRTIPCFEAQSNMEGYKTKERMYVKLALADLYRYKLGVVRNILPADLLLVQYKQTDSLYLEVIRDIVVVYGHGNHRLTIFNIRARRNWASLLYYEKQTAASKRAAIKVVREMIEGCDEAVSQLLPSVPDPRVVKELDYTRAKLREWENETYGADDGYEVVDWATEIANVFSPST